MRMPTLRHIFELEKTWTMVAENGTGEAGKFLMKR